MSRSQAKRAAAALALVVAGCAAAFGGIWPAHAQDATDARIRRMIDHANEAYSVPSTRPIRRRCSRGANGEIVVCGRDNGEDLRVPSTAESDPDSRAAKEALDNGVPHADVGTHYGGTTVARGCFVPPCPQPPAYMIDFSKLPDPPPGSDADRISKGEKAGP